MVQKPKLSLSVSLFTFNTVFYHQGHWWSKIATERLRNRKGQAVSCSVLKNFSESPTKQLLIRSHWPELDHMVLLTVGETGNRNLSAELLGAPNKIGILFHGSLDGKSLQTSSLLWLLRTRESCDFYGVVPQVEAILVPSGHRANLETYLIIITGREVLLPFSG